MRVHGSVANPVRLSRADLHRLGGERLTAVLECARSGAPARPPGPASRFRRCSTAPVSGRRRRGGRDRDDGHRRALPLRDIRCEPIDRVGAGRGALTSPRLLVPGWAGEASVKRLVSIEVVDESRSSQQRPIPPTVACGRCGRCRPGR